MTIHPGQFPALVLNADYRPLSVYPLSTWSWMDAIKAIWLDRVVTVSEYEDFVPHPTFRIKFPSVIALKEYQPATREVAFNRYNLWLRDGGICQYSGTKSRAGYCAVEVTTRDFTFDHVEPKSRGGEATWENIVCACQPCNTFKANRTPKEAGLVLLSEPRKPKPHEVAAWQRTLTSAQDLHHGWMDYLYWDTELLAK